MLVAKAECGDTHRQAVQQQQLLSERLERLENPAKPRLPVRRRCEELIEDGAVRREQHQQAARNGWLRFGRGAQRLEQRRAREQASSSQPKPSQKPSPPQHCHVQPRARTTTLVSWFRGGS